MPHALRVAVAIAVISGAVVAMADPAAGGDLNADTRALVAQLTAERAITLAKERRLADAAQEELYRQLAAKDLALRAAKDLAAGNAAERDRMRKARDEIARQRQDLIAALEQRDRALAAEVQAYREEVTKLAASPRPRETEGTAAVCRRRANQGAGRARCDCGCQTRRSRKGGPEGSPDCRRRGASTNRVAGDAGA